MAESVQLVVKTEATLEIYNKLVRDAHRMLAAAGGTETISSGVITIDPGGDGFGAFIVAAESGTADDLETIGGAESDDVIVLEADAGDTITLVHGSGNIYLPNGANLDISASTYTMVMLRYNGSAWKLISGAEAGEGGSGDVTGPASSTDNAIARFNGTGGKDIQNSVVTIDDTTGVIKINAHQALTDPTASPSGKFLKDDGLWDTPSGTAWDGDIADINLDGGTDIGADLVDADLILVDDGAGGKNRKAAISRVKTYAQGIKIDDLTAGDDNTDLDASTTKHGLLLKATAPAANELNVVGIGNGETAYTNKDLFNTTNPETIGTAAAGTGVQASRSDHVHAGDHGNLSGLSDDDHTQYIKHSLADAAGDMLVATADNAFGKLTKGADGKVLTMAAGAVSWETPAAGVTDHGLLTGLSDDDHTQYTKKATLTEQGDVYYASAASTPAALAHGNAGDILQSGGHGANPSWLAGSTYAVAAKGVTNGDSHDHNGGDGAAIVEAAITLADNTTNDATTTKHGFLLKATAPAANELNVVGIGNGETAYTNKDLFNTTNPATIGTAAAGTGVQASRSDHVHAADHGALAGLSDDDHTQYVLKSLYDAYTMLYADTDNTPAALTLAASRLVGRAGSGGVAAISLGASLEFSSATIQRAALTGDATASANSNAMTVVQASGIWALPGDISPTALSANTNDWAPTGLSTAGVIRASTSAAYNITGLTGGADGRIIVLLNVGAYYLKMLHDDAASSAANRFYCPNNTSYWLEPNAAVTLIYDSTSSRWRVVWGKQAPTGIANTYGLVVDDAAAADDDFARFTTTGIEGIPVTTAIAALLASALPENTAVILDAALSADGTYSGIVEAGTAGAALAFGDLCYLAAADSRWEFADADAEATAGPVKLGMCVLAAAGDGSATTMLLIGKIRADAVFPAMTISAPVYVGTTAGDVQVAAPSGAADIIRIVGHANTADELFFNPSQDWFEHA